MAPNPAFEIRHVRYFLAAADHGSFRKAGIWLDVQESAVSRRIRDLEDRLGASLFQRHSGGVRLTLAGERFLDRVRHALRDIEAGAFDVAAIGQVKAGRIKIGTTPGAVSDFLVDLLRDYDRAHAGVRIDFLESDAAEQVAALRRQEIDVALAAGSGRWDGCEAMPLWSEPVFVVLHDKHHLADRTEVDWHHLAEERFIGDRVGQSGIGFGLQDRRHAAVDWPVIPVWSGRSDRAHLPLVALRRGVSLTCGAMIIPEFPGVVYRPIVGEKLPFSAFWLRSNDNPALRRLLAMARRQPHRAKK